MVLYKYYQYCFILGIITLVYVIIVWYMYNLNDIIIL